MAHSHDKTYIASLGFNDKDRINSLHDLACQYIAQESNLIKVFKQHINNKLNEKSHRFEISNNSYPKRLTRIQFIKYKFNTKFEEMIIKGTNQYKTTIGFIDLIATLFLEYKSEEVNMSSEHILDKVNGEDVIPEGYFNKLFDQEDNKPETYKSHKNIKNIYFEIKITPIDISSAVRQIKFYKEYIEEYSLKFILATKFKISEEDLELLKNENIGHLYLGEAFENYVVEKKAKKTPAKMIEI